MQVDHLQGSEGVAGAGVQGVSKLRARTAQLLADQDDRSAVILVNYDIVILHAL